MNCSLATSLISFVVAVARNGVIGKDGGLPWRLPSDLRRFRAITMGKPVVMGRRTWESLPRKPLPGRRNIVVTRQQGYEAEGAEVAGSVEEAVALAAQSDVEEIAVIGGAEIFAQLMPRAGRIYLTEVDLAPEGDTFFTGFEPESWYEVACEEHERRPEDSAKFRLRTLDRISP